jgi:hypothetical protein
MGNQPVGVIVNYHITLTGYVDQPVVVRWSLWSLKSGSVTGLPEQWLRNRPIQTLIGQAVTDSAGPEFWIPLPTEAGPFEVEIGAYGSSGRLDYRDSRPFR